MKFEIWAYQPVIFKIQQILSAIAILLAGSQCCQASASISSKIEMTPIYQVYLSSFRTFVIVPTAD